MIPVGGGAWPFLVGELICLVNSDNERDLACYATSGRRLTLEGPVAFSHEIATTGL